jgi:pyruvate-formate lyase-activating enzyme
LGVDTVSIGNAATEGGNGVIVVQPSALVLKLCCFFCPFCPAPWIVAVLHYCIWETPREFVVCSIFMLSTYALASGHCQLLAAESRKKSEFTVQVLNKYPMDKPRIKLIHN